MLGIDISLPVGEIFVGQQHLRDAFIELGKMAFVQRHQLDLSHRGERLFFGYGLRFFFAPEPRHAGSHCAGTDHDDFLFLVMQFSELTHQSTQPPFLDAILR